MGRLIVDRGEPLEAQRYLRRALEVHPLYGEARVNLGRAYQQQRKPREAESAYRVAIGLDPTLPAAYNNLALLYQELRTPRRSDSGLINRRCRPTPTTPISTTAWHSLRRVGELGPRDEPAGGPWTSIRSPGSRNQSGPSTHPLHHRDRRLASLDIEVQDSSE